MGVVLGKGPDPHQAVEGAGTLVAVDQAQLGGAQGQIPVGAVAGQVPEHGPGAVHGLEGKGVVVHFGEVHVLGIVIPVSRLLPQALIEDLGGADFHIPVLGMLFPPQLQELVPDDDALGMVKGHPRTIFANGKEVQLPAQLAVIPLLGLFQELQMFFQLTLLDKGSAVHPLVTLFRPRQ